MQREVDIEGHGVRIRPLAEGDSFAELTELLHRAYAGLAAMGLNYTATFQDEETTRRRCGSGACWVAESDGRLVATVTLRRPEARREHAWFRGEGVFSFEQFGVSPELQRAGLGRALLREIEAEAKERGAREIACDTAEPAHHLVDWYEREGYRFVDRVHWRGKSYESLILSKRLAGPKLAETTSTRPPHWGWRNASAFLAPEVAAAYAARVPYAPETFDLLEALLPHGSRRVLDLGCGTGDLARPLAARGLEVDAVDVSPAMIDAGRHLPGGGRPELRWQVARAEEAELREPYGLVTAGQSLHWMEWERLFPRLAAALEPGGRLAIVDRVDDDAAWRAEAKEVIHRHSAARGWQRRDLVAEVERGGFFRRAGEHRTSPRPHRCSIEALLEAYHSRSSLSPLRLGPVEAQAFDAEMKRVLRPHAKDGLLEWPTSDWIVWGAIPRASTPP